jgi:proteasome alpha subunit
MQFYAPLDQINRDRSEYARKGIARGRSVVVCTYAGGVLFVAENPSTALHKVSEIYDRIGFAAVGRYNEYEALRGAGVRLADLRGYSYDRRDVTGRALANAYAQTLGAIFSEPSKPYEVEICVAQVGTTPAEDELYRLTFDGSIQAEPGSLAMGGQAEAIAGGLRERHRADMSLAEAVQLAVEALGSVGGEGGPRQLAANQLEVAVLDRQRTGRTFRRITGAALAALLTQGKPAPAEPPAADEPQIAEPGKTPKDASPGGTDPTLADDAGAGSAGAGSAAADGEAADGATGAAEGGAGPGEDGGEA